MYLRQVTHTYIIRKEDTVSMIPEYRFPLKRKCGFLHIGTNRPEYSLGCHPGTSVQDGCRPAFIMSNDTANLHSGIVTVVPLTSKLKKSYLPTHVILADECPALEPSMVLGEQLTTIGKTSLKSYVGRVSLKKVHEIEKAVEAHLGLALSGTG